MVSLLGFAVISSGNRTPSGKVANFCAASLLTMISWPALVSGRGKMVQAAMTVRIKNRRICCSFLPEKNDREPIHISYPRPFLGRGKGEGRGHFSTDQTRFR